MKRFSDMEPGQKALSLGAVALGVIVVVLVIFLAITWVIGDPTNDQGSTAPPARSPATAAG